MHNGALRDIKIITNSLHLFWFSLEFFPPGSRSRRDSPTTEDCLIVFDGDSEQGHAYCACRWWSTLLTCWLSCRSSSCCQLLRVSRPGWRACSPPYSGTQSYYSPIGQRFSGRHSYWLSAFLVHFLIGSDFHHVIIHNSNTCRLLSCYFVGPHYFCSLSDCLAVFWLVLKTLYFYLYNFGEHFLGPVSDWLAKIFVCQLVLVLALLWHSFSSIGWRFPAPEW